MLKEKYRETPILQFPVTSLLEEERWIRLQLEEKNNKTFYFSGFGKQIAGKWRYVSNCKEILKKSCIYENFQLVVTFRIGHLYKGRSGEQNANIDIKGEAQWKNFLLFFVVIFCIPSKNWILVRYFRGWRQMWPGNYMLAMPSSVWMPRYRGSDWGIMDSCTDN